MKSRAMIGEPLQWLVDTVPYIDTDECVEYPYAKSDRGYGYVRYPSGTSKMVAVTNITLQLVGRPWHPPLGAFALHSCDNPPCVNPRHLRWGWFRANGRDMANRGFKGNPNRCSTTGRFSTGALSLDTMTLAH